MPEFEPGPLSGQLQDFKRVKSQFQLQHTAPSTKRRQFISHLCMYIHTTTTTLPSYFGGDLRRRLCSYRPGEGYYPEGGYEFASALAEASAWLGVRRRADAGRPMICPQLKLCLVKAWVKGGGFGRPLTPPPTPVVCVCVCVCVSCLYKTV